MPEGTEAEQRSLNLSSVQHSAAGDTVSHEDDVGIQLPMDAENSHEPVDVPPDFEQDPIKLSCYMTVLDRLAWYGGRLTGFDQSLNVFGFYPSWELLLSFLFVATTLAVMGVIESYTFAKHLDSAIGIFIPAFGASSTVVFAVPKAPIAQPRSVILSHVSAALIGVALANAFAGVDHQPFGYHCAAAIGVGLHLALTQTTNILHPPASATVVTAAVHPLWGRFHDRGFLFVVAPVLLGSLCVVLFAGLLNNLVPSRSPYPQYW